MKQTEKQKELLDKARARFKSVVDVESDQRKREVDDLKFQVPENQWSDEARAERRGKSVRGKPVPARPMLSVPKLDQPIQLVLNQERNAHLGINIHPISPEADDDVAETIQGIYRQIERDSQAPICRSWAFERAVKAGRGRYRVTTKYCEDPSADPFDQEISIERILHQESVYWDPSAQRPDYSDAQWCFVTSFIPLAVFQDVYPNAEALPSSESAFADQQSDAPEWTQGSSLEDGAIQVAEYFWFENETEKLILYSDGSVLLEGQGEPAPGAEVDRVRERSKRVLMWAKMTATEVLEGPTRMPGKYIPIIEVAGRELVPFDSKRIWYGMIRPARDSQKGYNFSISGATEMAALEPKAPWLIEERQLAEYKEWWSQTATRNFPYLPYKGVAIGDKPVPPPQRTPVDLGRLGPSMALVSQFDQDIQASTMTFDPTLGNFDPKNRSGKAIQALQSQADAGNSHYMHSMVSVAMAYEAKVVLDLIPKIYDRPGRIARVLDNEEKSSTVMLNTPFVRDPKGNPVEAKPNETPAWIKPGQKPEIKSIDLAKGIYGVHISVGRAYQTRLQQGADEVGKLLEAVPNLWPMIGPEYMKFRDFPGHDEIAKILTKVRESEMRKMGIQVDEGEGDQPTVDQAMAEVMQLKQQLQDAQKVIAAAKQERAVETTKQQAQLAKAEADNQSRERVAAMDNQTKVLIAQMQLQAKQTEDRLAALEKSLQRRHETQQDHFQAAHEVGLEAAKAERQSMYGNLPQGEPGAPLAPDENVT
jgi:hypothetical protein